MIGENKVCSDTILIAAPQALVWDVLVDFDNYAAWNEFCPLIKGELRLGAALEMHVDLGQGPQLQVEYVSRIEPPQALAWRMENRPGDPIHAERTQYLSPRNAQSCYYLSEDIFSGEAVSDVLALYGEATEAGFNRCGYGLKHYCEQRHSAQNNAA